MDGGNSHAVYTFIYVLLIYVLPSVALASALVLYTKGIARKVVVYGLSAIVFLIAAYELIVGVFLYPKGW